MCTTGPAGAWPCRVPSARISPGDRPCAVAPTLCKLLPSACRRPAAAVADSEAAETDPRAVLDFLHIMLEFPPQRALRMVARRPALLHLDVYEDLLPVLAFLEELGLTSQQYAAVVSR